jgi:hypothetical protein
MKLIKRTANTLMMRYRPWGTWLYCSAILGMGIAGLMFRVQLSTFSCTRNLPQTNQGHCQLAHYRLVGSDRQIFPLETIKGVNLAVRQGPKGGEYNQIYLVTTMAQVELQLDTFQSLNEPQLKARKIQNFLSNPSQSQLKIQENSIWISVLLNMLTIGVAGITMLIMGGIRTLHLDRVSGKLKFKYQGLRGTQTFEYPLNHVKDVMIREVGTFGKKNYYVAIVLKTGFPLSLYPPAAVFRNRGQRQYGAKQILDFINASS